MVSYLFTSPSYVTGTISRPKDTRSEPTMLVSPFPSNFGLPMKYAQGPGGTGVTPMVAGDSAAVFAGILARAVPAISQSSVNENFNQFQPNQSEPNNLVIDGYVGVPVNTAFGPAVRGAPVFVVVTASAGHPAGTFETAANGGNNVALSNTIVGNVTFASDGVDTNGVGEVRISQ